MKRNMQLSEAYIDEAKQVVEQLSFAVMTDHEDTEGLGECLILVVKLADVGKGHEVPKELHREIMKAKDALGEMIRDESADPEGSMGRVREAVARIQEAILLGTLEISEEHDIGDEPAAQEPEAEDPGPREPEAGQEAPDVQPGEADEEAQAPDMEAAEPKERAGGPEPGAAAEVLDYRGVEPDTPAVEPEPSPEPAAAQGDFLSELLEDKELFEEFLTESRDSLGSIEVEIVSLEKNPDDVEIINAVFRPFHTIKGVSGFMNLMEINQLTHKVETLLDEARSGNLPVTDEMIDLILDAVDILKSLLDDLEVTMGEGRVLPPNPEVAALIGAVEEYVDAGGPPLAEGTMDADGEPEEGPDELIEDGAYDGADDGVCRPETPEGKRVRGRSRAALSTVKVDTEKLDYLVDMVGELVIAQSMVAEDEHLTVLTDQRLQKNLGQVHRIMAELQRVSMSLRMVPIKHTFERMIRLVRDLAKKSGKRTELRMQGEDTEIDRLMVEEIYEPLVHMIRNAVDHGLEDPRARREAGKPAVGTIRLSAYHQGGNVVIEVAEDGRGLDLESIRAKALERGIIGKDEHLSDNQMSQLIFHPGFSTAKEVSDVSGRGVGMDVVKKSIEKLRGKIEIDTKAGEGTTFTIQLPLTLAIIDGMLVRVGSDRYIIPSLAVHEALRPKEDAVSTVQNRGEMIMVRGSLIPLIRLHELFGIESDYTRPWESLVVVVEGDGGRKCLMVDELLGKQEVVIKNLGGGLNGARGISGAAILGDGQVGLILDITGICEMAGSVLH